MVQTRAQETHQETRKAEAEIESPAVNINQSLVSRLMERNREACIRAEIGYARQQQMRQELKMTVLAIEAIESAKTSAEKFDRDAFNAGIKAKMELAEECRNAIKAEQIGKPQTMQDEESKSATLNTETQRGEKTDAQPLQASRTRVRNEGLN